MITAVAHLQSAVPDTETVVVHAMIEPSVDAGFVVCDPFVGSGSAAIATLKAECTFVGADLSDRAVNITNWRSASFLATGDDPMEGPQRLPLPENSHLLTCRTRCSDGAGANSPLVSPNVATQSG